MMSCRRSHCWTIARQTSFDSSKRKEVGEWYVLEVRLAVDRGFNYPLISITFERHIVAPHYGHDRLQKVRTVRRVASGQDGHIQRDLDFSLRNAADILGGDRGSQAPTTRSGMLAG